MGMANQEQLDILTQGVEAWNKWRKEYPDIIHPDLSGAILWGTNFSSAYLSEAILKDADLSEATLSGAILSGAKMSGAILKDAKMSGADLKDANLSGADLSGADLSGADLSGADLSEATLSGAILSKAKLINSNLRKAHLNDADLHQADLFGAYLSWADFSNTNLSGATLFGAYLREANLSRANLSGTDARRANFFWPDIRALFTPDSGWGIYHKSVSVPSGANLSGANLSGADLSGADLSRANLSGADLRGTNFSWANLSGANLSRADLTGCFVYAISAWDVHLEETIQANLIITAPTDPSEPSITVDNLEVAQFIYLLLNNKKIRDVIDTIARKAVLILGRFTPERKAILDALREALRVQGYLPILFDFEKPSSQDLTETVSTLAHLSRFIIVDLTDPSSTPYEVGMIASNHIRPIQALFQPSSEAKRVFAMFSDLVRRYHWVLPPYEYQDQVQLLASLQTKIIKPAEQKAQELEKR